MTTITVSIPQFGVDQPFDPATGVPWADQATADAWRSRVLANMQASADAATGPAPEPDVSALIGVACAQIDDAAGQTRMRYITDVPGQGAVYLRKIAAATAFRDAGFTGVAHPYIELEAASTGRTPRATAEGILAIVELWDDQLSPAIECLRVGGKKKVAVAAGIADRHAGAALVATELATTLAALRAIGPL